MAKGKKDGSKAQMQPAQMLKVFKQANADASDAGHELSLLLCIFGRGEGLELSDHEVESIYVALRAIEEHIGELWSATFDPMRALESMLKAEERKAA